MYEQEYEIVWFSRAQTDLCAESLLNFVRKKIILFDSFDDVFLRELSELCVCCVITQCVYVWVSRCKCG